MGSWVLFVCCFLLIVASLGTYLLTQQDDFEEFIAEKSRRELKIGDNLNSLRFPDEYHATGVLRLPTSEVNEPFEIWFSRPHNQSRIDYYGGDVNTYQRGDLGKHGMFFKLVPKYSYKSHKHWRGCWKRFGQKKRKVGAQSILPRNSAWPFKSKLVDFKYAGEALIHDTLCTKWVYNISVMHKDNKYVFYATKTDPPLPMRLEMDGYDTVLVSYYDSYVIDYHTFNKWTYDKGIFDIPHLRHDKWCWDISKFSHGSEGAAMSINPMAEFTSLGHSRDLVDDDFDEFRQQHDKVYEDDSEHRRRKHIFRHNVRYIRSMNRRSLPYKLEPNHFADLTDDEFKSYKDALDDESKDVMNDHDDVIDDDVNDDTQKDEEDEPSDGYHGYNKDYEGWRSPRSGYRRSGISGESHENRKNKKKEHKKRMHAKIKHSKRMFEVPDQLDWRNYGAVNPAKGQGTCGSCWAFATAGAVEAAHFIQKGELLNLAEQQLLDCTWSTPGVYHGNNGCLGGWTWKAFSWVKKFGLATTKSYGHYRGQEGFCKTSNLTVGARITSYRRVKRFNPIALKKALSYHGPATISINANPKSLKFYSDGIMSDKHCSNKTDHAVLLIGYGSDNGVLYWLIKNSWSHKWGNNGFIKIKQGLCGIEKRPFVVLNKSRRKLPWQADKSTKKDEVPYSELKKHYHRHHWYWT